MNDAKLEKALNRFAEIGGGKFKKIPEELTRAQSKVNVLEEELKEELDKTPNNEQVIRTIKVRLAIALSEVATLRKTKGI